MLAALNASIAAESLDLGTCLLGSIGGDPESIIKALRLPKYTFPLVGLLVGHADQSPQKKPRLPREITTSVDTYPDFEADWYSDLWEEYDQTVQTYYDLRDGGEHVAAFTKQLCVKPGVGKAEKTDMLGVLHRQGLCLY